MRADCRGEAELMEAIVAGRWPRAVGPELRAHVAACATCAEIAAVAPALRDDFVDACRHAHVPAAGQVWWRAAVRARLDTAESAARPMTWMHGLAGAGAAGLLLALVAIAWPSVLGYAAPAFTSLLPRAGAIDARVSAPVMTLLRQMVPLLVVVALCMLVAPVAVYLATSDE